VANDAGPPLIAGPYGDPDLGQQFETAVARRERLADNYDLEFGQERVFPELIAAMLEEVPADRKVLEVGAATGLLTRPLLEHSASVTAMEPSSGLLGRLLASDVAASPNLATIVGVVEELSPVVAYDTAVVTFTPRRGLALVRLLTQLALRVSERVVVLMPDDTSLDWAYLARSAAGQGFDVRVRLVHGAGGHRAIVLTALVQDWQPLAPEAQDWAVDARAVSVPFPAPRGAATRLVRFFLSGGDRALSLATDPRGVERLYGNLRTAVHRLAREELTVRRHGDVIQLVRLPRAGELDHERERVPWVE
jgi:hypothetical protein